MTKMGVPRFKLQTNRSGVKWFVKTIMNPNSYDIMDEIRMMVLQCSDINFVPDVIFPVDINIPQNVSKIPKPVKDDAIAGHVSRFEKK